MKFNDKTNPEVVMAAYLVPTIIHLSVARAWHYKPVNPIAVLLNRRSHQFTLVEVQ